MAQTKRKGKPRSKQSRRSFPRPFSGELKHPELWGLGFVALGLFLGSVVYVGWNGGYVGAAMADGLDALIGGASWLLPILFVALGGLMVARSALIDVRPFRTGLELEQGSSVFEQ